VNQPLSPADLNLTPERPLTATRLAQYATARGRCERYLRLALFPSAFDKLMRRYGLKPEALSPLLAESGNVFEREAVAEIAAQADVIDLRNRSGAEIAELIKRQDVPRALYYQVRLEGRIGAVACGGTADLIEVVRRDDAAGKAVIDATVIDIKASRRNSVSFCLQIAFYARLLKDALAAAGLPVAAIRGAIIARDEVLTAKTLQPFDLALFEDEIERLVAAPDSDVARILATPLNHAHYHLSAKCDGCPYNAVCFVDSAEREDLSLVPLSTATEKRALAAEGVRSLRDLAGLMNYGPRAMEAAPGRERDVARISQRWPLGGRLPVLAQRARAALRSLDRSVEAKPFILGSGFGSLPDQQRYPDLVKVFVDAQHDYIQDRVYLLSALVAGPEKTIEVVEMTSAPPDTDAERALMTAWLGKLLPAISRAAGAASAPLHVYLFDRRDQSVLLDVLTRHFDALCAIPAFYDLLTSSPALTQGMISFLADEVRERRNLAPVCQNLYRVASAMGFEWREGELDYWQKFRARAFGYRRAYVRDAATGLFRKAQGQDEAGAVHVESAARFGTQIPLEYAYAAWGRLQESDAMREDERAQLRGFAGVTADDIRGLAAQRARALHYVEKQFTHRNRAVEKVALDLSRLDRVEVEPAEVPLSRSLEDFLLLEHHAKRQAALLYLSEPPALRAQTGRTAVVRCERYEKGDGGDDYGAFVLSDVNGAPLERDEVGALRLQAGSWVVVNSLANEEGQPRAAWEVVRGRLGVIDEIDGPQIGVRLKRLTFKPTRFRYSHRQTDARAGEVYTLDEMVDDLNADKFLEACRHAEANHLYRRMSAAYQDASAPKPTRLIRPSRLRAGLEFAELASASQRPHGLTAAQRGVVGEHYGESVLVVQGPPGTGKSHTLGLAILARAFALRSPSRPFRVAVAAKTHAAVGIVLASVVKRLRELVAAHACAARLAPFDNLRVAKVCNDAGEDVPDGVEVLLSDGGDEQTAGEQWQELLSERLLIVGGTPGGLYQLIKKGAAKGKKIDWSEEYFDLVVVDEASQMSIAEALTAAAFLNSDGQFIAVGDHRQMPPILQHTWDEASRRDLERARPHLSIFEYLIELGFARTALDESFRIPAEVADFLHRHVYAKDGITFRSANRARLPSAGALGGWLAHALAPEHPMILIEHDERGSQQANECEARLIEELACAACDSLRLDAARGIGVVVPHRAQKALLQSRLPHLAAAVDTVERFQGGERELIIVSTTVSDVEYAESESGFLLEPRRLTVAVSRPQRKLIVIAARTVFGLIPADLDDYERGALWKHLRRECAAGLLWEGEFAGHQLRIFSPARLPTET
jgi:CRISPR/Cas system-associated exonuclease Cas4 (RecB family)